jgi:hypothetical protein
MLAFIDRFPRVAGKEMLILNIVDRNHPLPPGRYGFFEHFCTEDNCDCRRVILVVRSPQFLGVTIATISYGWETEEFYTRWMHGDARAGREIAGAHLEILAPQSELADTLLDGFKDYVRRDSFYPGQLKRHYAMFKGLPQKQRRKQP